MQKLFQLNGLKTYWGYKMNVFEMEKEFNELVKQGQELIEKLKNSVDDCKPMNSCRLGWVSDHILDAEDKGKVDILCEKTNRPYPYSCKSGCCWKYFKPLTPAEVAEITGYKVEE